MINFSSGARLRVTLILNLGISGDYYIALGLNFKGNYEFPHKDFYWASSSNYVFSPLPAMLD